MTRDSLADAAAEGLAHAIIALLAAGALFGAVGVGLIWIALG
jgi:hypothetical protein